MIFSSTHNVNTFRVIQVPTPKASAACFAIVRYTALEKNAEEIIDIQMQESKTASNVSVPTDGRIMKKYVSKCHRF